MMTTEDRHNQVVTFGCRLNSYESQAIKSALDSSGQSNMAVFNGCAVTSQAEKQLRQAIRRQKREHPEMKIVVTGCAAQIDPERYAKMTEVDLVLGNEEKSQAQSYDFDNASYAKKQDREHFDSHQDKVFYEFRNRLSSDIETKEQQKIKVNDIMSVKEGAAHMVSYFDDQTRAFLEIQNGCNHRCSFCIIPFGRGNSRSVMFKDIVEQTRKMVAAGHKEVVLTGVDISDYGKDLELQMTLSQMIKRLLSLVPELPRLRLSSIDVAEIDDGFWDLIAGEERFMPYFHLSVQSGDDMILKRMKRRHNRSQVIDFCQKARSLRPDITFGSDIIAGFPTETDEMFENSIKLIEEANLIFNHIFPYSVREGTVAANMPQLDGNIIKQRARALREASERQLQKYLKNQNGGKFKVIIEKDGRGKSENFLDIDLSNFKGQDLKVGEIIVVTTEFKDNKLIAV